jgi:uncharacterized membrane protein YqgA involved in biofilm formation
MKCGAPTPVASHFALPAAHYALHTAHCQLSYTFANMQLPIRGTLLNTATVLIGSVSGYELGKGIPSEYQQVALSGLGLVVCLIAVKMFFESKNAIIVIASVAIGGILGQAMHIAPALAAFAEAVRQRFGGGGTFNEGLITTSVLFCVGPMTLLGCLQDGIEGKIELLAVKSTLDGISSFFFAAALGAGVIVTAFVVLVVQGALTLAARPLHRFAKDAQLISEATAVGGALMLGIGLGLLHMANLSMETYLPSLVLAPLFVLAARRFEKRST